LNKINLAFDVQYKIVLLTYLIKPCVNYKTQDSCQKIVIEISGIE